MMKKIWKACTAAMLAGILVFTAGLPVWASSTGTLEGTIIEDGDTASEDEAVSGEITQDAGVEAEIVQDTTADDHVVIQAEDKPYLALGANLNDEQKNTVLSLLGVDPAALDQYQVVTVTNEEEHQYLDDYLDASTIGTRALSSVVIVKREKGDGIHISTKNISYCTVGMYKNALVTAGLEDADIIVAGPFPISGTAALIGVMKAYADMEDTKVDTESLDAAMNEIVLTGELSDALGDNQQSEEFMAYLKQKVVEGRLTDSESIREAIDEAAQKFDISLSDGQKEQVATLMKKISSLDLDVDNIIQQAESIYKSISDLDTKGGIMGGIADFFRGIVDSIIQFFQNLF